MPPVVTLPASAFSTMSQSQHNMLVVRASEFASLIGTFTTAMVPRNVSIKTIRSYLFQCTGVTI